MVDKKDEFELYGWKLQSEPTGPYSSDLYLKSEYSENPMPIKKSTIANWFDDQYLIWSLNEKNAALEEELANLKAEALGRS